MVRGFKVSKMFIEYKNMVINCFGRRIKFIQSDNRTEFVNNKFDEFLKMNGIQRRLTVLNNPEQNGVAERKNRTLVETARCMLIQSNLAAPFWAEVIFLRRNTYKIIA